MKEGSLANMAYVELRKKILSNQLTRGSRLVESFWAQKLNVSRVSVREALIRLSGESLVEFGEKGGCFVKSITVNDVREIKELREVLELGSLELLFLHYDRELVSKLERICDDFSAMVAGGYLNGACEADIKFHETIIAGSKNERLFNIYQHSNIPLFHQRIGSSQEEDDYSLTDDEHRKIVKALKKKDFETAKETLRKHLERGEKIMLDLIPREGDLIA
ncbi:MAG: GntR family transcriptional regulator [Agriterribacter sp.]